MTVRELDSPPSLTALYPRAVGVPLLRRVPVIGGASKELPDTELEVRDVETSAEQLAAYNEVCGFSRDDVLAPTYPHIVAFPLAVGIMAERAFPFPLLGLVHIGNEIVQHRPIGVTEPLTVRVRAQDLEPHDRGTQFAMAAEARVGQELVWSSRNVYLRRHGKPSGAGKPAGERDAPAPERNLREANRAMTLLDEHLKQVPYVAGETFTMGDIPVGATAHRWLEIEGIDRPPLAAVRAWRARLAQRPGFREHVQLPLS